MFPTQAKDFLGFYEIPGYSTYVVNESGMVINRRTGEELLGSTNPDGYHNFRMTDDFNYTYTFGRHRLLAYVFKHPGVAIENLTVNHRNGIKGDDCLNNLEWTTYQGNAEHAGSMGLTEKCIPISVRNVDNGIVIDYPSMIECARDLGLTKDAVSYRISVGEQRVFPERKQYRIKSNIPWFIPPNIDASLSVNGTTKSIQVKFVFTGEIRSFEKLSDFATAFGISPATATLWINQSNQPVLPGFIQLKWLHDTTPWRAIGDPYAELEAYTGKRCIRVTHVGSGKVQIFTSAVECAEAMQLKPTTLNQRLKNPLHVYSDGYTYCYHSSFVQFPRSYQPEMAG